jgi:hypothetical protein
VCTTARTRTCQAGHGAHSYRLRLPATGAGAYTANAVPDRALEQLRGAHGQVELIRSNLSSEQEATLRDAFGEE